jgi:hypothetical protein
VSRLLFDKNGVPKEKFENHPGVKSISALLDELEDQRDYWLVY